MPEIIELVPSSDAAPTLPSRIVTVNLAGPTEGALTSGERTVSFRLVGDIHASADRMIVGAGYAVTAKSGDRVRLPVYAAGTGEWAIEVKKSWAPHPYAIRIPAGSTAVDLSALKPVITLPSMLSQYAITGAGITITEGAQWDASVALSGGVLGFTLTVPRGAVAWDRGALGASADLATLDNGSYSIWAGDTAEALGLPTRSLGIIESWRWGANGGIQRWTTRSIVPRTFVRSELSGGWGEWHEINPAAQVLTASDVLDDLPHGDYEAWSGVTAAALGLPTETGGFLEARTWGTNGGIQRWTPRVLSPTVYTRARLSGGWSEWTTSKPEAPEAPEAPPPTSTSPSGYKTVPLAVTLGNNGSVRGVTAGTVRIPLHFAAPITRWRVHISDGNPRFSLTKATQWTLRGMAVGAYDGTTVTGRKDIVTSPITTTPGSSKIVTPWTTAPLSGRPSVLQFAYSDASERPIALAGACWTSSSISAWRDIFNSNFGALQTTCPFDIWIEAETRAGTPVVAVVGDSNSAGVGTTMPVHDSWLSQWARAHDALPMHLAHSGDSLANQGDATAAKWTRWSHLARPDMAIIATGSNDLAGTVTLEDMQARFATVAGIAAELLSPIIHAVTLKPRNGETAGSSYDAGRKAYNAWLSTVPDPARAVHDFVGPVSANDQVMRPGMAASDGTHMTTAGHAALAAALPSSITPGPLLYASDVPPR